MKFVLSTLFLSLVFYTASAQTEQGHPKANEEVQEEMKMYIEKLKLTPEQQYYFIQILGEKREEKTAAIEEIEKQIQKIESIDRNSEKKIMSHLTEEQKAIYTTEISPTLEKKRTGLKESVKERK